MFTITRLTHAILYVRDAQRSLGFYGGVLGFAVVEAPSEQAVFLRASGSDRREPGLFGIGMQPPPPTRGHQGGLYHLAWEVKDRPDLAHARVALLAAGALVGESDRGNSMSLYGRDPDGNQLEVFRRPPRAEWEQRSFDARPLDLAGELARRGFAGVRTE